MYTDRIENYEIEKKELIKGLSLALDLAEKRYVSHSQHIAYLSVIIGRELGLDESSLELLFYSALLHDIGAGNSYDLLEHCKHGAKMVEKLPIDSRMSEIVMYHHEFIDGSGPFMLKEKEIPLLAQIINIANQFDYKFQIQSYSKNLEKEHIIDWINSQRGLFSKMLIDAFMYIIVEDYHNFQYFEEPFTEVISNIFKTESFWYGMNQVKQFAMVFSDMIDNRSSFTHRHSIGLTEIVERMAIPLGYDSLTKFKMHIAALLHDIGKLGIDNSIIDKAGKLSSDERIEIEKHAKYTYDVLGEIKGFEDIALWASQHHEKLNGLGYPFNLKEESLSQQARLLAISDIYQALKEERPYRSAMSNEGAFGILQNMVNEGEIDGDLLVILMNEFKDD